MNIIIILQRKYVVYPPEGERPPTAEEFEKILQQDKLKQTSK